MKECCDTQSFVRLTPDGDSLTDPGKAEGVEFTIGTCANCGSYLISCWVGGGIAHGYGVIDQAFVERLRAASAVRPPRPPGAVPQHSEREDMLARWWNDELERGS
jgi:hypothetical protein